MSTGFPLINIDGKVTEPVTVLIKKVSDAIGGSFTPYQIRRIAQAQSEAAIIEAQAQIEITDLQRRALTRFVSEESGRQNNIETIIQKAIPQLTDSSTPQDMQDDWITNFFDKSRILSDDEMQAHCAAWCRQAVPSIVPFVFLHPLDAWQYCLVSSCAAESVSRKLHVG